MSAADSLYQSFGGLVLPIANTAVDTTLVPLDPARSILLKLFASAINSELGDVWTKVTNTLDKSSPLRGTKPVQDTLELPPNADTLGQRKEAWPLLTLCRVGTGRFAYHTLYDRKLIQGWQLNYILGPTSIADERKLGDVCVAASKIIDMVIEQGFHNSYEAGALQFYPDKAALARIELLSIEGPGQASFIASQDAALHFAISINIETEEMARDDIDHLDDYEGTAFEMGLVNLEESTEPLPIISADTDAPLP